MNRHIALLLLLCNSVIFGMQQAQEPDFLLDEGAGPFNILSTDLNCLFAARLAARDKNALRTTCKAFSKFLPFCNASKFVLYPGFCGTKKDICSVFVVATFDNNHQLVEGFCHKYGSRNHYYSCIEPKRRFVVGSNSGEFIALSPNYELFINPYYLACHNQDTKMVNILEKYNSTNTSSTFTSENQAHEYSILPQNFHFLIACISRNTQRIIKAINNTKDLDDKILELGLAIIIDNDDAQSLAAIMKNEKIDLCIKKNGTDFLDLAIFGWRGKAAQILISSKCFDFGHIKKEIDGGFGCKFMYEGTYLEFLNRCNELSNIDESIFDLLKKNDAQTEYQIIDPVVDPETIVSLIKSAWNNLMKQFLS